MAPQFYCTGRKKIMLNKKMNRVAAVCSYMSPFHIHKNSWIHRKKTGKLPSFKPLRVMSIFDEACWICPILHQSRPSRGCYVYVPSRKLTYPILGKKKLISNRAVGGDMLITRTLRYLQRLLSRPLWNFCTVSAIKNMQNIIQQFS